MREERNPCQGAAVEKHRSQGSHKAACVARSGGGHPIRVPLSQIKRIPRVTSYSRYPGGSTSELKAEGYSSENKGKSRAPAKDDQPMMMPISSSSDVWAVA